MYNFLSKFIIISVEAHFWLDGFVTKNIIYPTKIFEIFEFRKSIENRD